MNILVRAPNWIGDQILAFPFFYALRKAYPDARIVSVCVPWVKDLQYMNLIDECHVLADARGKGLLSRFRSIDEAAKIFQAETWDLGFSLPNSISAAWFLFRAGAKKRIGYRTEGRGFLFTDALKWDDSPHRHRAQAYVDLLPEGIRPSRPVREFWGVSTSELYEDELDPRLPGELESFDPENAWKDAQPLDPPSEPYWVMAPGAMAESRQWSANRFAELAKKIATETGLKGVVVGGPRDVEIAERLCERSELNLVDYSARGAVVDLWKVFRGARFTVTNESGLAHMASLCGSPLQIVCGAADPRRTRPLGPGPVQVTINAVECWPCEKNSCFQPDERKLQCLRGITPNAVWEEINNGFKPKEKTPTQA